MKIIILGNTNQAYSWFVRTTKQGMELNGYDVILFDYKLNSFQNIKKFLFNSCDENTIVFTHLTFHHHHNKFEMMELFSNLRKKRKTKFIHTLQDARKEPRYNGNISEAFDMALIGQNDNRNEFENIWKVPVKFWPYSSMTYNNFGTYKKELDFKTPVFPGNPNSHSDRSTFIKLLKNNFNFKTIKPKSKNDIRDKTLDFAISSPCVLCLCTGYNIKHYTEVRCWQYGGAGAVLIMRKFKEMDDIFPENLYYSFDDYDINGVKKIKEYWKFIKSNDNLKLRQQIFGFVQTYHSSKERMKQTIELVNGEIENLKVFVNELDIDNKYLINHKGL